MRILMCSMEAPLPPINGFRLHLSHLLRELRKDHTVRVVALRYPDQKDRPVDDPDMRMVPRPSIGFLGKALAFPGTAARRQPLGVARIAARLRGPLHEEIDRFDPDIVHMTSGELAILADELSGRPSVLVPVDAWYLNIDADILVARGLRKLLLPWQARWVRRFEGSLFRRFGAVVVVSEGDRDALLALDPTLRIAVIPNGVDTERFRPGRWEERDPDQILFTGAMSYAPNVAAVDFLARRVMPLVLASCPNARLAVVGRNPSPEVRVLARSHGVEVVGEVPDLGPWLRGSMVYACPMVSGTGIKNKLLEAMASGLACVGTPLAVRGMHVTPGRDVLLGTTAEEVSSLVVRILADVDLARSLGRAAREYVLGRHSWASTARAFEGVYWDVLARSRAG